MKLMKVCEHKLSEKLLSLHRALAETDKLSCAAWWDFFSWFILSLRCSPLVFRLLTTENIFTGKRQPLGKEMCT